LIDPHLFALFMLGAVALNLTPGPDMAFCLAQGAHGGPKQGLAAALGVGTGAILHMALAAFGLTALLAAWPAGLQLVRWVGAAYLLWMAWGMVRHPGRLVDQAAAGGVWKAFRQGALTNAANPKVAVFFMAFLPQFVSSHGGPAWAQILILGAAFDLSGTLVNGAVGVAAGGLAARMRRAGRLFSYLSAGVMSLLAVRLAWR
jgi:threonine/homoserine/homoserine lactone efflux protein